jgi:hypothetical protein
LKGYTVGARVGPEVPMSRNFDCPELSRLCEREDCRIGLCVEQIDNGNRQDRARAMAHEKRDQFLKAHPEHLNLDDFL